MNHMGIRTDNHPLKSDQVSKMLRIRCWNERILLHVLPDMDTRYKEFWTDWHMIVRTIRHPCNQWCTGQDWHFSPSCILVNCLRFEATDFHHRHKSDSGNHCNHLDNSDYMDNLEKMINMIKYLLIFKPFMQSVRVLPQSMRQLVSEHDWVQSTYSSSHWPSHLTPISSSLKKTP